MLFAPALGVFLIYHASMWWIVDLSAMCYFIHEKKFLHALTQVIVLAFDSTKAYSIKCNN